MIQKDTWFKVWPHSLEVVLGISVDSVTGRNRTLLELNWSGKIGYKKILNSCLPSRTAFYQRFLVQISEKPCAGYSGPPSSLQLSPAQFCHSLRALHDLGRNFSVPHRSWKLASAALWGYWAGRVVSTDSPIRRARIGLVSLSNSLGL